MTEPTTPTGKRLLGTRTSIGGTGMGHVVSGDIEVPTVVTAADILAIEAEAKAQERERLRAAIMDWERYDLYFDVLDLLADPEDDR